MEFQNLYTHKVGIKIHLTALTTGAVGQTKSIIK